MPVGYSIYTERDSFIHKEIDPRTKMAVLGGLFIIVLCFNHPAYLAVPALFVALTSVWAQLGLKSLIPSLLAASWILILSLLIWPFYIDQGIPLFTVFNFQITVDGILFAVAMGLRVSVMIMAATVWMMITSPQYITLGLLKLGLPYKAGIAMSSSIRFIPLINAERATIVEAQRARGLDYKKGGLFTRIFRSVPIIAPLFLRAIELAQSLAIAMDARGFGVGEGRTNLYSISTTKTDKFIVYIMIFLVLFSIIGRVFFGLGILVPGYL
jgi:energy-coupling factor transport system permease protein